MTEKEQLIELATGIVLAQGNVFIKELLRDNGIKIGATKADFQRNLITAIESGKLTREHFDRWLQHVEGWGKQHVYLFHVDDLSVDRTLWRDRDSVRDLVEEAGYEDKWDVPPSMAFSEERELAGIHYDDVSFRITWYEGHNSWVRAADKDFRQDEDGDLYEYRAHRLRVNRSVTRFEWPCGSRFASVFIQAPWNKKHHDELLDEVLTTVNRFIPREHLSRLNIGSAIRNLDQAVLNDAALARGVHPQMARLETGGGYIDFGCSVYGESYGSIEAVRQVRLAILHPEDFTGNRGVFHLRNQPDQSLSREEIKVEMYGSGQDRIKIAHQCNREDAWIILGIVAERA